MLQSLVCIFAYDGLSTEKYKYKRMTPYGY